MCRIVAVETTNPKDIEMVFKALRRAAEYDHIAAKFMSPKDADGWGFAIYAGGKAITYRTGTPIYQDKKQLPDLTGHESERIYAIFHTRRDTWIKFPLLRSIGQRETYVCSNGAVFTGKLMDHSLNSVFLTINKKTKEAGISYQNFFRISTRFKSKELYEAKNEYFEMYERKLPEGGRIIMSSTLAKELGGERVVKNQNKLQSIMTMAYLCTQLFRPKAMKSWD